MFASSAKLGCAVVAGWLLAAAPALAQTAADSATASASSEATDWATIVQICAGGFSVVIFVLVALALATAVMNYLEIRGEALSRSGLPAAPVATPASAPTPPAPATGGPPSQQTIHAVIAASVAVALEGRSYRVRRIHLAEQPSLGWSQQGRARIHASHAVGRGSNR